MKSQLKKNESSDSLIAPLCLLRQVLPTVRVWLQVNFGQLTCAAHASCSALLCFLAGAWRQRAEGITLTVTVSFAHYRRGPASDRPPAALTFVLGADWELRSTGSCADRRVFHYCWALGIVGNHHFQWNTIVSECRTRGNAASCVYNIIWVTRRWRSRESTRKLLEKEVRKNRCLKHWSLERQRRHLNLNGGRGRWGGSDHLRRSVRAEQIPSQHL